MFLNLCFGKIKSMILFATDVSTAHADCITCMCGRYIFTDKSVHFAIRSVHVIRR